MTQHNREEEFLQNLYDNKPFLVPTAKFDKTELRYGDWLWLESWIEKALTQAEQRGAAKEKDKWENDPMTIEHHKNIVRKFAEELLSFIKSAHPEPSKDTGWSIELDDVEAKIKELLCKQS